MKRLCFLENFLQALITRDLTEVLATYHCSHGENWQQKKVGNIPENMVHQLRIKHEEMPDCQLQAPVPINILQKMP